MNPSHEPGADDRRVPTPQKRNRPRRRGLQSFTKCFVSLDPTSRPPQSTGRAALHRPPERRNPPRPESECLPRSHKHSGTAESVPDRRARRLQLRKFFVKHRKQISQVRRRASNRLHAIRMPPQRSGNLHRDRHIYAPTPAICSVAATISRTSSTSNDCCRYVSNSASFGAIGRSTS